MNAVITNFLGFTAAILTTLALVPQLVKIIKTKSVNDISLGMFSMFFIGVTLWLVYGLLIKSPPLIVANFVSMIMNMAILAYKFKYAEKD